jgi:hypothetical protein
VFVGDRALSAVAARLWAAVLSSAALGAPPGSRSGGFWSLTCGS